MNAIINGFYFITSNVIIETIFKLLLIVFLSGLIGYERESWNKPAGFRTHVLVGISATLVMICGDFIYRETGADPGRMPAQLLSGIGFLGAGTILRDGFNVRGLTTAAGLLSVTCIGLAVGAGFYAGAIIATIIVFALLKYSRGLSNKIDHFSILDLNIKTDKPKEIIDDVKSVFKKNNLEIVRLKTSDDFDDEKFVRVLLKYKMKINVNDVILSISKINNVKEVAEIVER